jgi:hypothetical protein
LQVLKSDVEAALQVLNFAIYHKELTEMEEREQREMEMKQQAALPPAMEKFDVTPSPAPAAGQPRALPLRFYDLVFLAIPPVQRLFFYDRADLLDVSDFTLGELPRFRDSLAAALHHFYPLAGKLTCELVDEEAAAPPEGPRDQGAPGGGGGEIEGAGSVGWMEQPSREPASQGPPG